MLRAGIDTYDDMRLRFDGSRCRMVSMLFWILSRKTSAAEQEMCKTISKLDSSELPKLAAAVTMAKPEYAMQVQHLAEQPCSILLPAHTLLRITADT